LEAAAVLCSGDLIYEADLPPNFLREVAGDAAVARLARGGSEPEIGLSIPAATEQIERAFIQRALARTNGNKTAAAKLLGISARSLHYKVKTFQIA
jgi:DNA-binding NtrC family response regulator